TIRSEADTYSDQRCHERRSAQVESLARACLRTRASRLTDMDTFAQTVSLPQSDQATNKPRQRPARMAGCRDLDKILPGAMAKSFWPGNKRMKPGHSRFARAVKVPPNM